MGYTKGEWKVFRFSTYHNWKVKTGDDNWFVDCGVDENSEANANLIAAAPDTTERLRLTNALLIEIEKTPQFKVIQPTVLSFIVANNKALAKAEGK